MFASHLTTPNPGHRRFPQTLLGECSPHQAPSTKKKTIPFCSRQCHTIFTLYRPTKKAFNFKLCSPHHNSVASQQHICVIGTLPLPPWPFCTPPLPCNLPTRVRTLLHTCLGQLYRIHASLPQLATVERICSSDTGWTISSDTAATRDNIETIHSGY
jgi:hypothetical protein